MLIGKWWKKNNYFLNQNIQCNKLLIFHTFASGYFEINRNIPRGFIHRGRTHSSSCFWIIGINILSLLCCLIFLFIDAEIQFKATSSVYDAVLLCLKSHPKLVSDDLNKLETFRRLYNSIQTHLKALNIISKYLFLLMSSVCKCPN